MSERKQNYQIPNLYIPPKNQNKQNQIETLALAPTIDSSRPEVLNKEMNKEVEKIRSGIGCGAIMAICVGFATAGAIGTFGYMYMNKQGPFDTTEKKPTSGEENESGSNVPPLESVNPKAPEEIYSNSDLKKNLLAFGIQAHAEDFDFETARPELQAKALYLVVEESKEKNSDKKMVWKPINQRITGIEAKELLVAIKIVNPYISDKPQESIVPEGLSYRARTADDEDPTIMYFYYNCKDKKGEQNMLAQIGIKDPSRPKRLMWARSFNISACD